MFNFCYKLIVHYSIRSRKILACLYYVRNKVVSYEDGFANILVRQFLLNSEYGIDTIDLHSNAFNVINKAWNTAFKW